MGNDNQIRNVTPVYVLYEIQAGDKLSDLLAKAEMTRNQWLEFNPWKRGAVTIRPGEKLVFSDSYSTCKRDETDIKGFLMERGFKRSVEYCGFLAHSLFWALSVAENRARRLTWREVERAKTGRVPTRL